eukprot:353045-Chlamydomonas_euryale.AAC.4
MLFRTLRQSFPSPSSSLPPSTGRNKRGGEEFSSPTPLLPPSVLDVQCPPPINLLIARIWGLGYQRPHHWHRCSTAGSWPSGQGAQPPWEWRKWCGIGSRAQLPVVRQLNLGLSV